MSHPIEPTHLLPSPFLNDTASASEPNPAKEPTSSPSVSSPPHFSPFFTLINTTSSSTTHHPTVHYIFTPDENNDHITSAAVRVLDPTTSRSSSSSPPANNNDPAAERVQHDEQRKERYVMVDMDVTGTKVVAARSMSPEWAVTGTSVSAAPTWDRPELGGRQAGGREEDVEGGLMLRIEGMEVLEGEKGERKGLEELVEEYERRMRELRRVVGAGDGVRNG